MLEKLYSSSIIDESAKLFKNIRCVNSSIGRQCCIGDDCDIDALFMEEKSQLGRRNLVRNSTIGKGSYTGTNTLIYNTDIGRYCSIAWNVSIGGENHEYNHVSCYTDYWYQRTFGLSSPCPKQVSKRTSIGNDVWIAAGANILGGGDNW